MIEVPGKYSTAKIMIDSIDETCMSQIVQMINNVAFDKPISIMPDCHSGKGSVIGFTMPIGNKLIANVVGVDIGCGMISYNVGFIRRGDLNHENIDREIRERIPFGQNINRVGKLRLPVNMQPVCKRVGIDFDYAVKSLGSLGGGK